MRHQYTFGFKKIDAFSYKSTLPAKQSNVLPRDSRINRTAQLKKHVNTRFRFNQLIKRRSQVFASGTIKLLLISNRMRNEDVSEVEKPQNDKCMLAEVLAS